MSTQERHSPLEASDHPSRNEAERDKFGIAFEDDNRKRDLAEWGNATVEQRGVVTAELLRYGGMIAESNGFINMAPAPRFPEAKV